MIRLMISQLCLTSLLSRRLSTRMSTLFCSRPIIHRDSGSSREILYCSTRLPVAFLLFCDRQDRFSACLAALNSSLFGCFVKRSLAMSKNLLSDTAS